MTPVLSIIIPCYNSEATLEETLLSVLHQDYESWEAIIINDGSPDNLEAIALKWVEKDSRFIYFSKKNGGLGSARNYGIEKARGEFILPLDSDNRIRKTFSEKAIQILRRKENVGVVYGDAIFFGERNILFKPGPFDKFKILNINNIDACALIRKSLFDNLGLYEVNMPYQGHEDWEFWLRVMASNYSFYYYEELTYDYRVSSNSMIETFSDEMIEMNIKFLMNKHNKLYRSAYSELIEKYYEPTLINRNVMVFKYRFHKMFNYLQELYNKIKRSIS